MDKPGNFSPIQAVAGQGRQELGGAMRTAKATRTGHADMIAHRQTLCATRIHGDSGWPVSMLGCLRGHLLTHLCHTRRISVL